MTLGDIHDPTQEATAAPLAGIRVLDFTRVLSGPFATLILADLGAEIIKVEDPAGGDTTRATPPLIDGQSHYFLALNRSKRSIAIDLKHPSAPSLVRRLARRSDVLVENFRPGVMERLGLGYDRLTEVNDGLVYCSISAFGQTGPYAHRPGFDLVVQGLSGVMALTGEPGGAPLRLGLSMGDLGAGLYAAIGIEAALIQRSRTGRGRFVDVSMLDGLVSLLTYNASRFLLTGQDPGPVGTGHPSVVPYGAYRASDGYLVLAPFSEVYWERICGVIGLPELANDRMYASNNTRIADREVVDRVMSKALARRTVAEWCEQFEAADVPHAPVLSVGEALANPQIRDRKLIREIQHPVVGAMHALGPGVRFDDPADAWVTSPTPPPLLGDDTRSVLTEILGSSGDEISELMRSGVIA